MNINLAQDFCDRIEHNIGGGGGGVVSLSDFTSH